MPKEQKTKVKIVVRSFKLVNDTFKFKADEAAQGVFEAYVSIFGNVDSYDEIVDRGAFTKSLALKFPKIVWSHNWNEPIGTVLEAREDEKGLYIKGQLVEGVQRAEEALKLMLAGAIDEFSIGYRVLEDYIGADGFRHLKTLRLYEVSPVLVGANSETELLSVKGIQKDIEVEEKEDTITHILTEEDLKNNPELEKEGLKVGDTVSLPVDEIQPAKTYTQDEYNLLANELKDLKEGRVLSEKNKVLIQTCIDNAQDFIDTLTELLNTATDPNKGDPKGGKVAPINQNGNILRIRHSAKDVQKTIRFIIREANRLSQE